MSMPLLAALFSMMGVFGAYIVGVRLIGLDAGTVLGQHAAPASTSGPTSTNGIIKSVVFGVAVSLIAVFEGYDAKPTAEGVSARDDPHRRRGVAGDPRARLHPHRLHVPRARHMNRSTIDLWVGIFVTIGFGAIVLLALKVGNLTSLTSTPSYRLDASFDNIGGLEDARAGQGGRRRRRPRRRASGSTRRPTRPMVTLDDRHGYQFTKDTIASILTSGLLGEVYIGLDAGGDTEMLADGGRIAKTQSAVVLEKLIGQFLFDKAASGRRQVRRQVGVQASIARAVLAVVAAAFWAAARRRRGRRSARAVQPRDVRRSTSRSTRTSSLRPIKAYRSTTRGQPIRIGDVTTSSTTSTTGSRRSTACCRASRRRPATTSAASWSIPSGLFGLIDIASDAGIERGNEDFGQTFGYWGFPQGAVPVRSAVRADDGPRRHRLARAAATWDRSVYIPDVPARNVIYGLGAVDLRAQALDAVDDRRPGGDRPLHVHPPRLPAAARVPGARRQSAAGKRGRMTMRVRI